MFSINKDTTKIVLLQHNGKFRLFEFEEEKKQFVFSKMLNKNCKNADNNQGIWK